MEEIAQAVDGKPIEIWFADEARVGQKNKITRRWAKRGTRPSAPKDQRTASAYIFGAICPAEGKGAGLVLPRCTTEGMTLANSPIQFVTPLSLDSSFFTAASRSLASRGVKKHEARR